MKPLLFAKITPPRLLEIVERPRLMESQLHNCNRHVVFILGQAGQGKSTLALSWFHAADGPKGWINLGPEDSDAVTLFKLLVQSVEQALPHVNFSPVLMFPAMTVPREDDLLYLEYISALLDLIDGPLYLVCDGLDRLRTGSSAYRLLKVLVEQVPPQITLIMLSREMPPFNLQDLKIKGAACVVDNEELAFTIEETKQLIESRKCFLTPAFLPRIHELTQGWIGGLVLLCSYIEQFRPDFTENDLENILIRYKGEIFQYFGEKILYSLPVGVQQFLVKSSPFDVIEPAMIQDIAGIDTGREILDMLVRRNLFVVSIHDGHKGCLYKYHQLFRDFLLSKFHAEVEPDEQLSLYLRCGERFEMAGEFEHAIQYYLQARAYLQAARLIERIGILLVREGKTGAVDQWLQTLPPDLIQARPWLLFLLCIIKRFKAGIDYIEHLHRLRGLFRNQGDTRGTLLCLALLLEATVARGDIGVSISELAEQSEKHLQSPDSKLYLYESATLWTQLGFVSSNSFGNPRKGHWASWNAYLLARDIGDIPLQLNALANSFLNLSFLGEFEAAEQMNRSMEALLESRTFAAEVLATHHVICAQGWILQGDLEKAGPLVYDANSQVELHGLTHMYPMSLFCEQLLRTYSLQHDAAREVGRQMVHLTSTLNSTFINGLAQFILGLNSYFAGDLIDAEKNLQKARDILMTDTTKGILQLQMTDIALGAVTSSVQADRQIEENLLQTLDHLTAIPAPLLAREAHLATALIKFHQGRIEEAVKHLKTGFKIAAENRYYHWLLVSPSDLARLCALTLENDLQETADYVSRLLTSRLSRHALPALDILLNGANVKAARKALELKRTIYEAGMPQLYIKTLGEFRVRCASKSGEDVNLDGNQPRQLLKTIIAHGSGGVRRDRLMDDLWPEASLEVSERSFRINLYRLRKSLEPSMDRELGSFYVRLRSNRVSLHAGLCTIDINEFQSTYERAVKCEGAGDQMAAATLYEAAAELYGGDFLAGGVDTLRIQSRREELRATFIDVMTRLGAIYQKQGNSTAAIVCQRKLLGVDPTLEAAYRRLMVLYGRLRMMNTVRKVYEECREVLKKELNVEPDEITTSLYKKMIKR
jgi:ATP/maltotriose-dependent transcriptional regulator MalT/DNA-binding SARP family transcriptional activator